MELWELARDVLLTGTGLTIIVVQVFFAKTPNDALLVTALALTAPSVAGHARALLSGPRPTEPDTLPERRRSGRSSSGVSSKEEGE